MKAHELQFTPAVLETTAVVPERKAWRCKADRRRDNGN
jgi:hypothetical protein